MPSFKNSLIVEQIQGNYLVSARRFAMPHDRMFVATAGIGHIRHHIDIIPQEMCLYWRNVKVCGLHTIKFFSTAICFNQSARVCMVHDC